MMRSKVRFAGVLALSSVAALTIGLAAPAYAKKPPKPAIQVVDGSTPYVTGTGFTPDGSVTVTDKTVGKPKVAPYTETVTADASGNLFAYLPCGLGGRTETVKAQDGTTGRSSAKSPPMNLFCIG